MAIKQKQREIRKTFGGNSNAVARRPGCRAGQHETLFDQWEGFAVLMVGRENRQKRAAWRTILERFYGPRAVPLPEGRKLCIISESDDAMELERLLREKWHKRFVCCCGFASNVEELPVVFQETQALLQNCIYFGIEEYWQTALISKSMRRAYRRIRLTLGCAA